MEIINGEPRRRRSDEEKLAILAEAMSSGNISRTAKRYGVAPSMVFAWRKQFGVGSAASSAMEFAPVALLGDQAASNAPACSGLIEVSFGGGVQLRISGNVDATLAASVAAALSKR